MTKYLYITNDKNFKIIEKESVYTVRLELVKGTKLVGTADSYEEAKMLADKEAK